MDNSAFEEFSDLFQTDDHFGHLFERLEITGRGDHAAIFAHPTRPDLVIRASDYPDGFFEYVLQKEAWPAEVQPFCPVVHAIAHVDGEIFVAICERLSKLDAGADGERLVKVVAQARRVHADRLDNDGRAALEMEQPGLSSLLYWCRNFRDLKDENWLRRGNQLVLNDPYSTMSRQAEADISERFYLPLRRRPSLAL